MYLMFNVIAALFPLAWNRITTLCKPDTDEQTESRAANVLPVLYQ